MPICPYIFKQTKLNESHVDEWRVFWAVKGKKARLPVAGLHRPLVSRRDIRKPHSTTRFDWCCIKLCLQQ